MSSENSSRKNRKKNYLIKEKEKVQHNLAQRFMCPIHKN